MLREILIEPFEDGDYFFGVVFWMFFLFLVSVLIAFGLWGVDSAFMPVKKSKGVVKSTQYNPSYTYITYIHSGKVSIPVTNRAPERYSLNISINGTVDNFTISNEYYDYFDKGDTVKCEYTQGRLFNTVYIKSIEFDK